LGLYFGGLVLFMALLSSICLYGARHAKMPASQPVESRQYDEHP
jgi:hypothetical protein